MNIKWLIIGGIFVVLLVAFGRNPIEEGRERRAEALKGKNPLIVSIEEHNSGKNRSSFGSSLSGGDRQLERVRRNNNRRGAARRSYQRNNYGKNTSPFNFSDPIGQPQQKQQPQQNQGYYPPPPSKSDGPQSHRHGIQNEADISFYGTKVFTKDAYGNKVPIPDGLHSIFGGRLYVLVKNGKKVRMVGSNGL